VSAIDWSRVKGEHVREACQLYDKGERPSHPARSTFLLYSGKRYDAKFIRGLAYEQATGRRLNPSVDYSGGEATRRFLNKLGFDVEYNGKVYEGKTSAAKHDRVLGAQRPIDKTPKPRRRGKDPQKEALHNLLKQFFGEVCREIGFDWLVVPHIADMDSDIASIFEALRSNRNFDSFSKPGEKLKVDYYIPSRNLIIEYDERQHFTEPRAITLRHYPANIQLGFDQNRWLTESERIQAKDPTPPDRDETRAFYDTLRDILATRHGMTVVRMKDKDYDWTRHDASEQLDALLREATKTEGASPEASRIEVKEEESPKMQKQVGSPTRIATVCVQGSPLGSIEDNKEREKLLTEVIERIVNKGWKDIDAVLLPGGFFCFQDYIGALSFKDRAQKLQGASFHRTCVEACRKLAKNCPGALIVAGVDTLDTPQVGAWPDQLCLAWSGEGIVGIGRKVFPVKPQKNENYKEKDDESLHYICYVQDYSDDKRVITLPNGRRAILCACYDMFGCSETVENPTARTRNIMNLEVLSRYDMLPRELKSRFRIRRKNCIKAFQDLLKRNNVSVGLAAIHGFNTTGNSVTMWQRHGIPTCSATLNGGLAIGAAHFTNYLPRPQNATLAALNIPKKHITEGHHRSMEEHVAEDSIQDYSYIDSEQPPFLVRLFTE